VVLGVGRRLVPGCRNAFLERGRMANRTASLTRKGLSLAGTEAPGGSRTAPADYNSPAERWGWLCFNAPGGNARQPPAKQDDGPIPVRSQATIVYSSNRVRTVENRRLLTRPVSTRIPLPYNNKRDFTAIVEIARLQRSSSRPSHQPHWHQKADMM
jgi:hypothetical protein